MDGESLVAEALEPVGIEEPGELMLDAEWAADPGARLLRLAQYEGNLTDFLDADELARLGASVLEDYRQDDADRKEWKETAEDGLKAAKQTRQLKEKSYPWPNCSNVDFPLLTAATLQWNARMYPAVIKGDEAVLCKVIGQDNGRPRMGKNPQTGAMQPLPNLQMQPVAGPDGQPVAGPDGQPQMQPQPVMGPDGQMEPLWLVEPGAKAKRARRVSEYLNTVLFYRMESWEEDTDVLLMQLPAVGCAFRKVWRDPDLGARSSLVPALRLIVPKGVSNLRVTPRITEELPDVFPYQLDQDMAAGRYRDVDLMVGPDDRAKGRMLIEQHRMIDMDDDGLEEPYIVTVDVNSGHVLRLEPNFGPEDIVLRKNGDEPARVVRVKRRDYFVKYGLFPDPEGGFYDLGLAHLLKQIGAVVNTNLNQLMDAATAAAAGGGFIGSGVRLQSRGAQASVIRFSPGEYKTVDVSGDVLRNGIVERTLPSPSPVTFQVLDMILGAANEISGSKDVLTGEASNNGQVGTTLALIEQGLQVFNATAKRVFRAFKEEFTLVYENEARFGGQQAREDYAQILDDTDADFDADFNAKDIDIRCVSDPSTVTRMQKLAKGQFVMSTVGLLGAVGGDPREALRRVYEAVDVEDIDKLLPPPKPQQQDPLQQAMAQLQMQAALAKASKDQAGADNLNAKTAETLVGIKIDQMRFGMDAADRMAQPQVDQPTQGGM
jgi:chaperonin GroES